MGKNMCKHTRSSDTQLTAATRNRSMTRSWAWFVSFIISGTREDGTFCPRLSNMSPDCRGTAKEKTLGSHCGLRSKGCFDGQCFRSSTHDLIIFNLFHLSKLKYRDTKASHIKKSLQKVTSESNWTFSGIVTATTSPAAPQNQGPPFHAQQGYQQSHVRSVTALSNSVLKTSRASLTPFLCCSTPFVPRVPPEQPLGIAPWHMGRHYWRGYLGPSSLWLFFKYLSTSAFFVSGMAKLSPWSVSRPMLTLNFFHQLTYMQDFFLIPLKSASSLCSSWALVFWILSVGTQVMPLCSSFVACPCFHLLWAPSLVPVFLKCCLSKSQPEADSWYGKLQPVTVSQL